MWYRGIMQTRRRKDVLLAMTPYLPLRSDGVRRFAREAGWNLIDTSRLIGGVGGLAGWRGDGAIVTLREDPETLAFVRRLRRAGIPVVDLSNQRPDIRIPRVCLDNRAVGRLAAEHFMERNHRRAAWFSTHWMNVHAERFAGFSEVWAAGGAVSDCAARRDAAPPMAGGAVRASARTSDFGLRILDGRDARSPSCGRAVCAPAMPLRWVLREGVPPGRRNDARAVARWLSARLTAAPKPLALFCHCIEDAARILSECEACGIRVPEEVAILATGDDQTMCETQSVPLSSIQLNDERHGWEAASLLARLMDGEPPPRGPVLIPPGDIVVRASTDWTAASDPLVAKALALVAGNLSRPWGVAQLSRELGVPPLRLGRHFTAELGRTPGEEILRQRLEKARELLVETKLPLSEIARECGFCHASYLSNLFRREMGVSPRAWARAKRPRPFSLPVSPDSV